jgi:protein-tyrosine phosphatase
VSMAETRWLPLQGAVNVRDLGDLPTVGGRRTARGRVLRADNLQELTPADVRYLVDDLGLRTVIDLRTSIEVEREGPGPLTREAAVVHRHCSLFPEGGRMTDVDADALLPWQSNDVQARDAAEGEADNPSVGFYLGYLRDRPDSVLAALRAMAAADGDGGAPDPERRDGAQDRSGAAIVHCAAGKDRTGVVVALALAAVGVPRSEIVADYVATGEVLDSILDRLRRSETYAEDLDDRPPDAHRPRPVTMERFLAVLDQRFGGPVGWLTKVGFTEADLAALRARLVE